MMEHRNGRYTGYNLKVCIFFIHRTCMKYIDISYSNRIMPIISTKSIFNVDDIGIGPEIIVKNLASSIDYRIFSIVYINPCLSLFCISEIIFKKEYTLHLSKVLFIRNYREIIRKYDESLVGDEFFYVFWGNNILL